MQLGNFINVFLARHVSGTYAHHQEHQILSCSIWFSAPSFSMGGGLESRCVGRVCGADGAVLLHETCRAKNTLIKLLCCIKLALQDISRVSCVYKAYACILLQPMQQILKLLELCFLQNEAAPSDCRLLGCDVMWSHRNLQTIRRKVLFPL